MSISSVSSQTSSYPNYQQARTDFNSLAQALQTGDLTSAQSAFTALQKDAPTPPPTAQSGALGQDFANLKKSLDAGDVTGAQSAFAKLQSDAKAHAHHGHHHHAQAQATAPTDTSGSTINVSA